MRIVVDSIIRETIGIKLGLTPIVADVWITESLTFNGCFRMQKVSLCSRRTATGQSKNSLATTSTLTQQAHASVGLQSTLTVFLSFSNAFEKFPLTARRRVGRLDDVMERLETQIVISFRISLGPAAFRSLQSFRAPGRAFGRNGFNRRIIQWASFRICDGSVGTPMVAGFNSRLWPCGRSVLGFQRYWLSNLPPGTSLGAAPYFHTQPPNRGVAAASLDETPK